MSKYNKEELENLILVQNLSYEAIGRHTYGSLNANSSRAYRRQK